MPNIPIEDFQYHVKRHEWLVWTWEIYTLDSSGTKYFWGRGSAMTKSGARRMAERRVQMTINPPKPKMKPFHTYVYSHDLGRFREDYDV